MSDLNRCKNSLPYKFQHKRRIFHSDEEGGGGATKTLIDLAVRGS